MTTPKPKGEALQQRRHDDPCLGLQEVQKDLGSIKTGARVSAFFLALGFASIMGVIIAYMSDVSQMSESLTAMRTQLTHIAMTGSKQEAHMKAFDTRMRGVEIALAKENR